LGQVLLSRHPRLATKVIGPYYAPDAAAAGLRIEKLASQIGVRLVEHKALSRREFRFDGGYLLVMSYEAVLEHLPAARSEGAPPSPGRRATANGTLIFRRHGHGWVSVIPILDGSVMLEPGSARFWENVLELGARCPFPGL